MGVHPAEIGKQHPSHIEPTPTGTYVVLYDGQCEICQACISWLSTLDGNKKTIGLPISAEALALRALQKPTG